MSDWEADREFLAATLNVIEVPSDAVRAQRVMVAIDEDDRRLGFSVVLEVREGAVELEPRGRCRRARSGRGGGPHRRDRFLGRT